MLRGSLSFRGPPLLSLRSLGTTTPTSVDVASHKLPPSRAQKARKLRRKRLAALRESIGNESLVAATLSEMETNPDFARTARELKALGQKTLTRQEKTLRRRALDDLGVSSFSSFLKKHDAKLERKRCTQFQMNVGLLCNQACTHCHVESSPKRTDSQMTKATMDRCLALIANSPSVKTVDLTGGAPELNEHFRYFVAEARKLNVSVIDRCNLTVLSEPGQEDLAQFLADHEVQVVASLPCYSLENVDTQRGDGVFDRSISGLLQLNELGYGGDSRLKLDLVYNPLGPFLPPDQLALEAQYKRELAEAFGIVFDELYTLTNLPIKRFADFLHRRGELAEYMSLLVANFNASTVDTVMCTDYVNVSPDGRLNDCDFNAQLDLPVRRGGKELTVWDVETTDDLMEERIRVGNHCFGCTAGAGSSCGGALV